MLMKNKWIINTLHYNVINMINKWNGVRRKMKDILIGFSNCWIRQWKNKLILSKLLYTIIILNIVLVINILEAELMKYSDCDLWLNCPIRFAFELISSFNKLLGVYLTPLSVWDRIWKENRKKIRNLTLLFSFWCLVEVRLG